MSKLIFKHKIYAKFSSFVLALVFSLITQVSSAQYYYQQSGVTPYHIPQTTTEYVKNLSINSGRFTGTIFKSDGETFRYDGTFYHPDGSYTYCTHFDTHFNIPEGVTYVFITADGTQAIKYQVKNGSPVTWGSWDLRGKQIVAITKDGPVFAGQNTYSAPAGGYGGSSSQSSGSNSNYNSHKATCGGCKGSGVCQHCKGTGWVNNHKSKCGLCHSKGRCVSCAGKGFKYGNY